MSAQSIAAEPLPALTIASTPEKPRYDPRTRALIEGPIAATLIRHGDTKYYCHVRAGLGRSRRNLFRRQTRHRCAGRRRVGFPADDADADDVGRRHGRRHVVGNCPRAWRRPPRRCRCSGYPRARHRARLRPGLYGRAADRRPLALHVDGRQRRLARCRADLFASHLCRRDPGLAVQFAGQRDPRHRQYDVSRARHLYRRGRCLCRCRRA